METHGRRAPTKGDGPEYSESAVVRRRGKQVVAVGINHKSSGFETMMTRMMSITTHPPPIEATSAYILAFLLRHSQAHNC